jgi:DNA-binding FadR family transcriptional regulator
MNNILSAIKPIQNNRKSVEVAQQIKSLIINKNLKPGDKLPTERELALTFSVGRPAIREALNSLNMMHLIEIHQGKGTFVKPFDYQSYIESLSVNIDMMLFSDLISLRELWEARKLVEPTVCGMAAERVNEVQLKNLEQILKDTEKTFSQEGDFPYLAAIFHREIAQIAGNRVLVFLVECLLTIRKMSRHRVMLEKEYQENALYFHQEILEAIRLRNKEKAQLLMAEHLERVQKYYDACCL